MARTFIVRPAFTLGPIKETSDKYKDEMKHPATNQMTNADVEIVGILNIRFHTPRFASKCIHVENNHVENKTRNIIVTSSQFGMLNWVNRDSLVREFIWST